MKPVNTVDGLANLLAGLRKDPQSVARAAAANGQRVVGYVGGDIPVALILAANALPVRLRAIGDAATPGADRFVESSFAPALRSIAEQWLTNSLDHLDAVIFSRGDDSSQRLYYYVCELQRRGVCAGPRPLLFDIAGLDRAMSFEHTLDSTRLLASQLGSAPERLDAAIGRVRRRAQLVEAVRTRRQLPAPLRGSDAWSFDFAAGCDWRESFDEGARQWLAQASLLHLPKRVVLAGDPPPDDQLHLAVEACGASVVLELTEASGAAERGEREPLAAIAEESRRLESPALAMRRNARWLADNALDQRTDAVLVWLSEQDEALPWEIARQMRALREAGVPALLLSRQPPAISAAAVTQVMHFVRELKKTS